MTAPTADLHILQNGIPRSGNVWLGHLIRDLLTEAGIPIRQHLHGHPVADALAGEDLGIAGIQHTDFIQISPLRCFYTILENFRWPIADLDAYVASSTHVATHSLWSTASAEVYRRFSHRIYILRDPRDTAISFARFLFTPYNRLHMPTAHADPQRFLDAELQNLTQAWTKHVAAHWRKRAEQDIHWLRYERLVLEPMAELTRLAEYLGLGLCTDAVRRVAERNAFAALKERQPQHLFKGRWGQWREDLRTSQVRQVQAIAGPLLRELGYPLGLEDADDWRPPPLPGSDPDPADGHAPVDSPPVPRDRSRP